MKRTLVALVSATLLIAACGDDDEPSSVPTVVSDTSAPTSVAGGLSSTTVASGGEGGDVPGVTAESVTVGLLTSVTGAAASSFANTERGVQARFDVENDKGGVNGRTLEVITGDDASNPVQTLTAAQSLNDEGVFAILAVDAFTYSAAPYMNEEGIPAVGACFDGPEWSALKNMFSPFGCNGKNPANTVWGEWFKSKGVTKLAVLCYGGAPASRATCKNTVRSAEVAGVEVVYEDYTAQFGQVDFGTQALAMKEAEVDGVFLAMVGASDLGVAEALRNNGVTPKAIMFSGVGYDSATIADPTTKAAAQDTYTTIYYAPLEANTEATRTWADQLEEHAGVEGIPEFSIIQGWIAADYFIAGLQAAGEDFTRESYIEAMHNHEGYDAGGLLPTPYNTSTDWGKGSSGIGAGGCNWVVQLKGDKFVVDNNNQPVCGEIIPDSYETPENPGPEEP